MDKEDFDNLIIYILNHKIKPNTQDNNGNTELHLICSSNEIKNEEIRKKIILLLLENGSNPSIKNNVIFF